MQDLADEEQAAAGYLRELSDDSLWLLRVYGDRIANAEIDARPRLRERRRLELAL